MQRLFIVSGRSGSGKTTALHVLEDFGFLCIDNLPLVVIPDVVNALNKELSDLKLALGVDARNPKESLAKFEELYQQISTLHQPEVLFLDASSESLIARFADTRRKHPLQDTAGSLSAALELESERLNPLRSRTSTFIDTGAYNVHQLKERLRIAVGDVGRLSVLLMSFGFKHGAPHDSDYQFDVRMLTNPHWNAELRGLTGKDKPVAQFLAQDADVQLMQRSIQEFLTQWLPKIEASGRQGVTVAVGCTGGKHRSVYLVEALKLALGSSFDVHVIHREQKRWK